MANLFHSFVSGGSNNLLDAVLPADFWNARSLVVGEMCLAGHLEAKPFHEIDSNLFRDLVRTRSIDLPTPTLKMVSKKFPGLEKNFQSGGNFHLIHIVCSYSSLDPRKSVLGLYALKLVYIPCTTNQTGNYLNLYLADRSRVLCSGLSSTDGQFYHFELSKVERDNFIHLTAPEIVSNLSTLALQSKVLKNKTIKATAQVG